MKQGFATDTQARQILFDLNAAKAVLAFEATLLAHGREETLKAYQAAISMFGNRDIAGHTVDQLFSKCFR